MPPNKAHGHDNVAVRSLKAACSLLSPSIARLVNLSIATACVPDTWKIAMVSPIHKSESKEDIQNYRPISLLPLLSKVLEKVICKQLLLYVEGNKILQKYFSGFRKHHSTQTALLRLSDDLLENIDKGLVTALILMDLSKAFDTLDHGILLTKLVKYGFDPHTIFWFDSYSISAVENST